MATICDQPTVTVESCSAKGMTPCPRCRHYCYSINFDGLCNTCVDTILTNHPTHESVPGILENLQLRGLAPEDNPARA